MLTSTGFLGRKIAQLDLGWATFSLDRYAPGRLAPHFHDHPGLFVLLSGEHLDDTGQSTLRQPVASAVVHPVDMRHSTEIGPSGMVGINAFFADTCLGLCDYEIQSSHGLRRSALRLTAAMATHHDKAEDLALEFVAELDTQTKGQMPKWFRRVLDDVDFRSDSTPSLSTLARESEIHPVTLCRAFRRHTGVTFSEYCVGLRSARFGEMILKASPIGVSAIEAGFADHAHGTRSFRRLTGVSPSAFAMACQG